MKKISQVLIESQNTRKQTTGTLVHCDTNNKIDSYCALGALGCEAKLIYVDNIFVSYCDIIKAYGVYPHQRVEMPDHHTKELVNAIFTLNDTYRWSFEKIGKWIEILENQGIITYNKQT